MRMTVSNRKLYGTRAAYIEANSEVNTATPLVDGVHCRDWTGVLEGDPNADCTRGRGSWTDEAGHRERKAHRIAYEAYVGPIPDGMCVCHRCDRGRCVEPRHLELGSHEDNMRQMNERRRNRWFTWRRRKDAASG